MVIADVRALERYWYEPYLKTVTGEALPAVLHWTDDRDVVTAIGTTARNLESCVVRMATHGRSRTAALVGSTFARLAVVGDEPLVAIGPRPSLPTGPDPRYTVACLDLSPGMDELAVDGLVLDGAGNPHASLSSHLAAHPATFLATATHGRTGASRALLGSETARIVHHSPVPVLVVPPPPDHRWSAGLDA